MTTTDHGTPAIPEAAHHAISATDVPTLDRMVDDVRRHGQAWADTPATRRVELLAATRATTAAVATEWVEAACAAKGITIGTPPEGEEWQSGPWTVLRNLRLLERSMRDIAAGRKPELPAAIERREDGRRTVRVFPTDMWDRLLFPGTTGTVVMQPGHTETSLRAAQASAHFTPGRSSGVKLVLGAGNIASIPAMDALYEIFVELRATVLKMNPVNEYLGPILERAFAPVVDEGVLRIAYGGAEVGHHLVAHPDIDAVHMTGSDKTYESIVFGHSDPEPDDAPVLDKPVTAELGNVTPVIVVPGPWSAADLAYQAENLAAWLTHNAGFNCIASRVVILDQSWELGPVLLDAIEAVLSRTPDRRAYYPGAAERHARFIDAHPTTRVIGGTEPGSLPWALIRDVPSADPSDICFTTEAFTSICAATTIEAASVVEFIDAAVSFANESVWGSLGASVVAHPDTLQDVRVGPAIERALDSLRYGTVGLNAWSGVGFALVSSPWGAFPGHDPHDIQSGSGVVHNSFMLGGTEKTIVRANWREPITPTWFARNRNAHRVLRAATFFEARPGIRRLGRVIRHSLGF